MQHNVLVIGGLGFIGSCVVRKLITKKNTLVHILCKPQTNPWRIRDIQKKIIFHHTDFFDTNALVGLFSTIQPEIIINFASYGNSDNEEDADEIFKINAYSVLNLLQASIHIPYTCFIQTGSSSEYGLKDAKIKETDICSPATLYAASKLSATALCLAFAKTKKKPIVVLRPFSVYGPFEERSRFIPTIVRSLIKNKPIQITKEEIRHDFVYIDDVVRAYCLVIDKSNDVFGEIINIGTGRQYSNQEVVKLLFEVTKKSVPVKIGSFPKRIWDTKHWVSDTTKMQKLLGLTNPLPFKIGLQKTYEWFINNHKLYEKA